MALISLRNLFDAIRGRYNNEANRVEGQAAHDAAANGNPVQAGGVYRVAAPSLGDGDVGSLRVNAKGEALVELTGSRMELFGATIATRPAANTVTSGATFLAIDTLTATMSDGTSWRAL